MCNVVVVSTNIPKPAAIVELADKPFIVTVFPVPAPFAIVATPLPLAVRSDAKALILTIVPAPSLMSGLVAGKLVSFAIGAKPPTSVTNSTILSLTA